MLRDCSAYCLQDSIHDLKRCQGLTSRPHLVVGREPHGFVCGSDELQYTCPGIESHVSVLPDGNFYNRNPLFEHEGHPQVHCSRTSTFSWSVTSPTNRPSHQFHISNHIGTRWKFVQQ
jgi:hypothetical protein